MSEFPTILGLIVFLSTVVSIVLFRTYYRKDTYKDTEILYIPTPPMEEPKSAPQPVSVPITVPMPSEPAYLWRTPQEAYHSTRVICDESGLTVDEKNLICACIYQESTFKNGAINRNKNSRGETTSTDWGICQINDYFNIGSGKPFPTVAYVVDNPEKAVRWMLKMYKQGHLNLWSSYKFGAYKQWLREGSPMWKLKT